MRQANYALPISNPSLALVGSGALPAVPGYTTTQGKFQNVVVQGNYAYVAAAASTSGPTAGLSLVVYDVSNPALPVSKGYLITFASVWFSGSPYWMNGSYKMEINGKYLYVFSSGSSVFYIIDVSNPTNPMNVGRLLITNSPGSLYGGTFINNYCYISTQAKGLTVVDVSNPVLPVQTYQEGGTLNKSVGVCYGNGYLYTTNYQTSAPWTVRYLKTWDLTNPASPSLVSTYTLPAGTKPEAVVVSGNYAYVTDPNTNTIQIINVSNPLSPSYISSMVASASFNVPASVAIDGNYAYISSGANAVFGGAIDFYDITNKAVPVLIKTITSGIPNDIFGTGVLYNNLYYVASYGVAPGSSSTLKIYSTQKGVSSIVPTPNILTASVQMVSTNPSASGNFVIEGSDSIAGQDGTPGPPTAWDGIGSSISISGSGVYLIPKTNICYQQLRLVYNNIGNGGLSTQLKTIGD